MKNKLILGTECIALAKSKYGKYLTPNVIMYSVCGKSVQLNKRSADEKKVERFSMNAKEDLVS